ncbi:hypothetical protein F5Y16DRAFT_400775 [Xylariaceae sp. FL0255]|nr:hypothetical protein F5Y16DRAFT_400775 [Xylariaceae sp. FL0255]
MVADNSNPFIRFKTHINEKVRRGVETVFGTPPVPDSTTGSSTQQHPSAASAASAASSVSSVAIMEPNQSRPEPRVSPDDVFWWAISSPYSPLNLQHLKPPNPQQDPSNRPIPEGALTFRDAFEDLLITSSPESVYSKRPHQKSLGQRCTANSKPPPHVADWLKELASHDFLCAYFPMEPDARQPWMWSHFKEMSGPRFYFSQPPFYAAQNPVLRFSFGHDNDAVPAQSQLDAQTLWAQAMEHLDSAIIGKDVLKEVKRNMAAQEETEEDMYSMFHSKGVSEPSQTQSQSVSEAPEKVETKVLADGSKRVITTTSNEHDGRVETTRAVQTYDPNGNLIAQSKESTSTRTWSAKMPGLETTFTWTRNRESRNDDQAGEGADEQEKSRPTCGSNSGNGWFWTR